MNAVSDRGRLVNCLDPGVQTASARVPGSHRYRVCGPAASSCSNEADNQLLMLSSSPPLPARTEEVE
jgi:hypothetical protein